MDQGTQLFSQTLADALAKNKRFLLKRPAYISAFSRIAANIKKTDKIRKALAQNETLTVPPVLIFSVTNDCNLSCKGCYACDQQRDKSAELGMDEIVRVVNEAVDLGVAVIMIAGGEPLLKPDILNLPKAHPGTLFVMFTNGLLLSGDVMREAGKMKNLIPAISLEGSRDLTDERRGAGTYDSVMDVMRRLDADGRLFGTSITLTSRNYEEVVRPDYLESLQALGCRAAFLIEYVPCGEEDAVLCLTEEQKQHLRAAELELSRRFDMLITALPGDEEKYGGCLASGRGFLHISSSGALEACPFAPFSDTNVKDRPLKDALRSRLLHQIRAGHDQLKESRGGCALKENTAWIESLQKAE